MAGFLILAGYGLVLCLIYLYLKKRGLLRGSVETMVFSGSKAGNLTLIFSVLSAWMWTTSIFAASETYSLYGVWGPLGYVLGACIAFGLFVAILCNLRRRMPGAVTYLDFLEKRCTKQTKLFFYIFAFAVSAYVLIEQAVGIADLLEALFGSSFKWAAFCSVVLALLFICLGGMKALFVSEKITAVVILTGFSVLAGFFFMQGNLNEEKIVEEASAGWLTDTVVIPAIRYFVMAIVIGFGQLVFDPAYYIKGKMAATIRQLKWTYLLGGVVLWGSLSLVSSLYLGKATAAGSEVSDLFTGAAAIIFAITITFLGISTIEHYLMGMLGIFTIDYYRSFLRSQATQGQMLTFGRVMTVAIGIFCALVAISLEDISLLTIDVFCAIFFAAPCGPLVLLFLSKRTFRNLPMIATSMGILGGILVWLATPSAQQWDQFLGMTVSFGIPVLVMVLGGQGSSKDASPKGHESKESHSKKKKTTQLP